MHFTDPFGGQDLVRGEAADGVRVQDGVDDVSASLLAERLPVSFSLILMGFDVNLPS